MPAQVTTLQSCASSVAPRHGLAAARPGISEVLEPDRSVSAPAYGPAAPGRGAAGSAAARAYSSVSPTGRQRPQGGSAVVKGIHRVAIIAAAVATVKSAKRMSLQKEPSILILLRSNSSTARLSAKEFQSKWIWDVMAMRMPLGACPHTHASSSKVTTVRGASPCDAIAAAASRVDRLANDIHATTRP